jgi:outer membrane protein OmpA-like peptidoglycan-associated protein
MIVAHAGARGDAVENMNLSIRRALAAAGVLVEIAIFRSDVPSTVSRN